MQSISALHPGHKVVDMKGKRNRGSLPFGGCGNSYSQPITKAFAKIQANPGRAMNDSPVLPGEPFLENTLQITRRYAYAVIFNSQDNSILFCHGRKM